MLASKNEDNDLGPSWLLQCCGEKQSIGKACKVTSISNVPTSIPYMYMEENGFMSLKAKTQRKMDCMWLFPS